MPILIGSVAIKSHWPDFKREAKDHDYAIIGPTYGIQVQKNYRFEYLHNPVIANRKYRGNLISENDLYTLKISHLFWDIKWEKHMFDVQFMKSKGCILNENLFENLYAFWNIHHGPNERSNLDMTAEDFFDNAITIPTPHDDIHKIVSAPDEPMYLSVLGFGEVAPEKYLFDSLTHQDKCRLVREEIYVMAWERMGDTDYRVAYSQMLKKFIINHAPLWEAIWICEHFKELHKPIINYKQLIDNGLQRIRSNTSQTV